MRSAEDRSSRAVCLEATSIVDWRDRSEGRGRMEGWMADDEAGRTELAPDEADSGVRHWLRVLWPGAETDYMILGLHVGMFPMQ